MKSSFRAIMVDMYSFNFGYFMYCQNMVELSNDLNKSSCENPIISVSLNPSLDFARTSTEL